MYSIKDYLDSLYIGGYESQKYTILNNLAYILISSPF